MNFFNNIKPPKEGEIFEELYKNESVMIEKIISSNKQTGKLYNQNYDEWVMLMDGEATLETEGEQKVLKKGDFILIAKNSPHKVLQAKEGTLWLCVHISMNS
ncbi:MAG: cupin domain-containing protein [Sulfurospirillum sp.]